MGNTFDSLYGNRGIDTKYEREILTYRPHLQFTKEQLEQIIRPEVQVLIERARTFTISQNLFDYAELIKEIEQMLKDIEVRQDSKIIQSFIELLENKNIQDIISFEKKHGSYEGTGDFELYEILYYMKQSVQIRHEFIDERFRTQLTNETNLEKIEEVEMTQINEWENLEAEVMFMYENMQDAEEDSEQDYLNYEKLERLEEIKRTKEVFYTSLSDTSYIHRNRYFMFLNILERAKILVYESNRLIEDNLKELLLSLNELGDFSFAKTHLIHQFKKLREKQESVKGRMMTIDEEKESFGSEKNYLYQQIETKTVEPLKKWLHNQEENISGALDKFSHYMVDSLKETKKQYEQTLADLLNFYKSEANFYDQQIYYLKEKEEIRRFYSILKDLEDVGQIQYEWVEEYLKANGYAS